MKRYIIAALLPAVLLVAGCTASENGRSGYTHASLLPRDIRSVRVYIADNPTFRREFELPITKAVINKIQSLTDLRVTDKNPDSILSITITEIRERASVENEYDVPTSGNVRIYLELKWTDARSGKPIPLRHKKISASASYHIGRGDNFHNAAQSATEKVARLVVECLQEEW